MGFKEMSKRHPMTVLLKGYDLNGKNLSEILKCSHPTAKRKIENPQLLTLGDLERIEKKTDISIEELREAVRW